jgi:hypothetical protein
LFRLSSGQHCDAKDRKIGHHFGLLPWSQCAEVVGDIIIAVMQKQRRSKSASRLTSSCKILFFVLLNCAQDYMSM